MLTRRQTYLLILIIYLGLSPINGTLTKSDKKKKAVKKLNIKTFEGPVEESLETRGLLAPSVRAKDILAQNAAYHKDVDVKHHNTTTVLAYVTPWNSKGYEIAEKFTKKFDLISPVWLQVKRSVEGSYTITGEHDVDNGWVSKLRKNNPSIKIVPRLLFDEWRGEDFVSVLKSQAEQTRLGQVLVKICQKHNFDGLVLEFWSQLGGQAKEPLSVMTRNLARAMRKSSFITILVLPPIRHRELEYFDKTDFDRLANDINYFSLMTYDFSSVQRPGPSSPLPWMKDCVESLVPDSNDANREKILLGLNFYGMDFTINGGGPILGRDFLQLLENVKPAEKLKYDDNSEENFIELKKSDSSHIIFYPTPYSILRRIRLAEEFGTGLSIWEIGQGLDFFYDLL
ncbi:chitinase domain-containing protein 1 [Neocloeon triangulifer]|uniref:chitinase domain-containing protein 1 n=1 Tax=Neocloeon triangulifer TaxID=2078957 RepID=UPI00286EBF59|nr:chitinase domain-containing protein 1 [Neocloeon triangulifer]